MVLRIVHVIFLSLISTVLFGALQPGAVFSIPGRDKWIGGRNWTSTKARIVHTVIFLIASGSMIFLYIDVLSPILINQFG